MDDMGGGPTPSPSWAMVTGVSTPTPISIFIGTCSLTIFVPNGVFSLNLERVIYSPSWASTSNVPKNGLTVGSTFKQFSNLISISSTTSLVLTNFFLRVIISNPNSRCGCKLESYLAFPKKSINLHLTKHTPCYLDSFNIFTYLRRWGKITYKPT